MGEHVLLQGSGAASTTACIIASNVIADTAYAAAYSAVRTERWKMENEFKFLLKILQLLLLLIIFVLCSIYSAIAVDTAPRHIMSLNIGETFVKCRL